MHTVILHIQNEEPVVGEMEELPKMEDQMIAVRRPRRRDNKELHYLHPDVGIVFWPVHRINFIEVVSHEEEEDLITFVRE